MNREYKKEIEQLPEAHEGNHPNVVRLWEKVRELIEAYNLETPTVKEENPYCKCSRCLACDGCHFMKVNCTCQPVTPPSNSEKEECCVCVEGGEGKMFPGCPCKCNKEEIKEDTKKKYEEIMLSTGYIKTPSGWIAEAKIKVRQPLSRLTINLQK